MTTKRFFDLCAATAGLVVLAPALAVLAVLIKVDSPGPVFYRGERVGRGGRTFKMLKFRTMVPNAERLGGTSTPGDDARLTQIGKILRRHKLDELPQLINVVKGDMSLVGPRPQVQWAVDLYSEEERMLLSVRPGITDYASLLFSNEEEILKGSVDPDQTYLELIAPEKIRLGLEYVRTSSLRVDVRLIAMSLGRALGREPR